MEAQKHQMVHFPKSPLEAGVRNEQFPIDFQVIKSKKINSFLFSENFGWNTVQASFHASKFLWVALDTIIKIILSKEIL